MRFNAQSFNREKRFDEGKRYYLFIFAIIAVIFIFILRLAKFQILDQEMYAVLASEKHDLETDLMPDRGRILVRDSSDGQLYPLAANRDSWTVYGEPKNMDDPVTVAHRLSELLGIPDVDLIAKFTSKPDDPYELVAKDISLQAAQKLQDEPIKGVGLARQTARLYPEKDMGGQVVGVVTADDRGILVGRYGIESTFESILAGRPGVLEAEKDAAGRRLIFAKLNLKEAVNGSDIVLTLDRAIQFRACEAIKNGVIGNQADDGTIIIMDVKTGAILAMCSYPDFDPSNLKDVKDVGVFNNPATFIAYEPGSVFKAITMAAGINENKINPNTTYTDKGYEEIDDFTVRNSDGLAHGVKTMTEVLEESLNTGTIFVQRQLGKKAFRDYVNAFEFGTSTGIELRPESTGDVSSLDKKGDIFAATASYGQGITVTPIQLVKAYGALANGGKMMEPHIISEIVQPDGSSQKTEPKEAGQPISLRTSQLVTRMLVSVVESGHGKRAGVSGYWVAGKTGTAQVPKKNGRGYETDHFIGTFIGYAPADNPEFVMLVKIDNPRTTMWAESTAAPIFGDMAKFLLQYLGIKPNR